MVFRNRFFLQKRLASSSQHSFGKRVKGFTEYSSQSGMYRELLSKRNPDSASFFIAQMTDPALFRKLAAEIERGFFNNVPEILEVFAFHIAHFLCSAEAVTSLLNAVCAGRFSASNLAMRHIADNLRIFTHYNDQTRLAGFFLRWNEERGSNPKVVAVAIRHLLAGRQYYVQISICRALCDGRIRNHQVLTVIAESLPTLKRYHRNLFFEALEKGLLGTHVQTTAAWIKHLNYCDRYEMQQNVTRAIVAGRVEFTPTNAVAFFNHLSRFTRYEAQTHLVDALVQGEFGTDERVFEAFAEHCAFLTGYQAQERFVRAVADRRLGQSTTFMRHIAENLRTFTGRLAQRYLVSAFSAGMFGWRNAAFTAFLDRLDVFRDQPHLQGNLAHALMRVSRVGDPELLIQIARQCLHLNSSDAQREIFNDFTPEEWPAEATQCFFVHMHSVTDVVTQTTIVGRITSGAWRPTVVLFQRMVSIPWLHHFTDEFVPYMMRALPPNEARCRLLSEFKVSPGLFVEMRPGLQGNWAPIHFFGSEFQPGTVLQARLQEAFDRHHIPNGPDVIPAMLDDDEQYAVSVVVRPTAFLVVKWCVSRADEEARQEDQPLDETAQRSRVNEWQGFVTSRDHCLYQTVAGQVRVYVWNQNPEDAYPTPYDVSHLLLRDPVVELLPQFLRCAVVDNTFNVEDYQYARLLTMVLTTVLDVVAVDNPRLADHLRNATGRAVAVRCAGLDISVEILRTLDREAMEFCHAYHEREHQPVFAVLRQAIEASAASCEDIAMLGFLCLQISKAGVLGHHAGADNFGNYLFYDLGRECVRYLVAQHPALAAPLAAVLTNLDARICAAIVSQDLSNVMIAQRDALYGDLPRIFDRR